MRHTAFQGIRMDEYIKGIFTGLLLACFFMLVAPKPMHCAVEMQRERVTIVTVGTYDD